MSAGCFYCDRVLLDLWDGIGTCPDDLATRDHVFPRSMLKGMGELSDEWRRLNRVRCCYRCNQDKEDMPPLRWLGHLSGAPADRLACLLLRLGADPTTINHARASGRHDQEYPHAVAN